MARHAKRLFNFKAITRRYRELLTVHRRLVRNTVVSNHRIGEAEQLTRVRRICSNTERQCTCKGKRLRSWARWVAAVEQKEAVDCAAGNV